mmetsp:Transcript_57313/g.114842  ORF Transcript_57313/g.114842 Transcript_57313/m.114842 type:complete len:85 (+) Transcript_57313:36-290(+)
MDGSRADPLTRRRTIQTQLGLRNCGVPTTATSASGAGHAGVSRTLRAWTDRAEALTRSQVDDFAQDFMGRLKEKKKKKKKKKKY